MSPAATPAAQTPMPVAALAGIIATVAVFAIAQGLTYPLLSFILQRQGVSPVLIGASAAMTPLGFIISSPFIPVLVRRLGPGRLAIGCCGLAVVVLVLIGLVQDVAAWFPLRLLLGLFANPLYVISETWMITIAPPERRGRIMGIYTSIVSAGFAMGPLTLALVGTQGWMPFVVGICAFLVCALCLIAVLPRLPPIHHEMGGTSVTGFLALAPLLVFAVFVAAVFEQSLLALFSVYGKSHGQAEVMISALLTTFIAGNIALQVPLGALTERFGSRITLPACAVTALLGAVLLASVMETIWVWPLVFLWGSVSFGIYTIALIDLGDRFSGSLLIAGNAAFAMVWGIGGVSGPPLAGAMMNEIGVEGLRLVLGVLCAILALFAIVAARRVGRRIVP